MPTYDYTCQDCGHRMESFQKITDAPLKTCPKCSKDRLRRGPGGGIGLSFKGSGFYKTDYPSTAPESNTNSSDSPKDSSKGSCCPCGKNKGSCDS